MEKLDTDYGVKIVEQQITMRRVWAMPSHDTFTVKPIKELIAAHITYGVWADPFSRNSPFRERCITNDLNPEIVADYHLEALEFLRTFTDASVDGVLFDPPYSPRQISECYKQVGREVHTKDTQSSFYGDRKKEIARIVKPGGKVLCFGWNSGGIGKTNGFELREVLLVPHGGAHNDTVCTVEIKVSNVEVQRGSGSIIAGGSAGTTGSASSANNGGQDDDLQPM